MCIGQAECLDVNHLRAVADTLENITERGGTSESLIKYSLIVAPDLKNENARENWDSPKFSWKFHKIGLPTAAKIKVT